MTAVDCRKKEIEMGFARKRTLSKQWNAKIGRLFNLWKQILKDLSRSIFNLGKIYATKSKESCWNKNAKSTCFLSQYAMKVNPKIHSAVGRSFAIQRNVRVHSLSSELKIWIQIVIIFKLKLCLSFAKYLNKQLLKLLKVIPCTSSSRNYHKLRLKSNFVAESLAAISMAE